MAEVATLNTHVGVHHPEHGSVLLGPDEDIPAWAIPLIANPDVWSEQPDEAEGITTDPDSDPVDDEDEPDEESPSDDAEPDESEKADEPEGSEDDPEDESSEESTEVEAEEAETIPVPPKAGPKGSAKAWAEYAHAKGFAIEGDPGRDEIIAALEAEGITTE